LPDGPSTVARAAGHALGRNNRAAAALNAIFVRIWRIGFLIFAGGRERTIGKCGTRYDVAASKSQIEFGEAKIMETNELI
jgi:hypothetical protein